MSMLRKSLHICRAEFASWRRDIRIYLVFLILLCFVLLYTDGVFAYAASRDYPVTPWLLPLQMEGLNNRLVVYGCAALFFSNIFRSKRVDQDILIRCGYRAVLLGKLLYILAAALLYCLLYEAFTLLPHINQIYLSKGWGGILTDWSDFPNLPASAWGQMPGDAYVIDSGSGLSMTLWTFAHLWLSVVTIGLLMFGLNSGGGLIRGGVAAGILIGVDRMTTALLLPGLQFVPWVSPLSWSNPALVEFGKVPADEMLSTVPQSYVDATAILLNVCVMALICVLTHRSYRNGSRHAWIHLS